MEKSYKYRIYPNKKQKQLIQETFGCSRFIYNYYLRMRMDVYKNTQKTFNYYECSRDLTQLKKELEWLQVPDKSALQNSLKDLQNAYVRFWETENRFPKFKTRKNRRQTYRTNGNGCEKNSLRYVNGFIRLPKIGNVKVRDKREPQGKIVSATVIQEVNGHYYVSLCCVDVEVVPLPKTGKSIGIDLGIVDFATLSDGRKIPNYRFYESLEKKAIKLQRELTRKPIGSSNREKSRKKLAKLHRHIAEQRRDFLQKLTTSLVREYDVICIEDLSSRTLKQTNIVARNKRVCDASWHEFRTMLEYKCRWYGKELVVIDKYFPSSQICHVCGVRSGKKRETIREWTCSNCGEKLDRDWNAAINILNEGTRQLKELIS